MQKTLRDSLPKTLLRLMSLTYQGSVATRHFAYDWILPSTKLSIPVISVGNIVAGGTGKTPTTYFLAKYLIEKGKKVAILSRGYKRKSKKTLLVKEGMSPEECGDEPLWLATLLPKAFVLVGASRSQTGRLAEALGAEVILLDDGMQHRPLQRDIEIGVMHNGDLFGGGHFLPLGLLRDHPRRLANAHLIFLTGISSAEEYEKAKAKVAPYTRAPLIAMEQTILNGSEITSKKVASFCAIGAPSRFQTTLRSLGCTVVEALENPDHDPFSPEELELLANRAFNRGATHLVCTEKDAVKLPHDLKTRLPIHVLKTALSPTFGKQHIQDIL